MISPVSFRSGLIDYRGKMINPDNVVSFEQPGIIKKTRVTYSNGEVEDISTSADVFTKAMILAKNTDKIVNIYDLIRDAE